MSLNSLGNSISRNGLVGEWLLDGNRNDTSGNGYNGTATNVTYTKTTKGYQAQAGNFTSTNSYVDIRANNNLNVTNYISVFWKYKPTARASNCYIFQKGQVGNNENQYCALYGYVANQAETFIRIGRTTARINIGPTLTNNVWYDLGYTYDGTTLKTYCNGQLSNTLTISGLIGNTTSPTLRINGYLLGGGYVNSNIQDFRIYNRALSQDEIQLLYLEGQRKLGPTSVASYPKLLDGLLGYWDFKGTAHNLVDGVLATNTNVTNGIDHLGQTSLNTYNGTSSKLSLPGSYINLGTGDFTVSFWVTLNQGGTDNVFLSNLTSSSPTGFSLCRDLSNKISLEQWNAGAPTVFNTINNYATGTYFVTFQRASSGTLNIYINGVLENTGTGTVRNVTSTQVCDFGRYTYNNTKFMNGKIDECIIQNRILSADEVSSLYKLTSQDYIYPAPSYDLPNLREGLVLDLNEQGKDLSGNGNHGTLVNAPQVVRQGKAKGLSYNGSNKLISIGSDLGIAGGNITMSAYVKLNAEISSGYYTIIKQNDLTSGVGFQMYYEYNGGTRRLTFQRVRVGIAGNPVYYNITLGTSNWYHLSLVNNTSDNTIKIYLNGVLVGSATSSNLNGNQSEVDLTAIGCYGTSLYANAKILSPRIRNRALSAKEIEQMYYSQKGSFVY